MEIRKVGAKKGNNNPLQLYGNSWKIAEKRKGFIQELFHHRPFVDLAFAQQGKDQPY